MEQPNFATDNDKTIVELPLELKTELETALYALVQNFYRGTLDSHTADAWVQEILADISSGKRTITSLSIQFYAMEENRVRLLGLEEKLS